MPKPAVRSIDSLRNLPVFPDDGSVSKSPPLLRYNLIYGFNGCGKTTLSRLFACLGTGRQHKEWLSNSTFSVTLTDGTKVTSESVDETLKQRTLVFNADFIAENFRWKEGEANPLFYLGTTQGSLSKQLDSKSQLVTDIDRQLQSVAAARTSAENAFAQHKTDRARLIERELELGRSRYKAPTLASDYSDYTYSGADLLDEESINVQRRILKLEEPLPKLPLINEQPPALSNLIQDVRRLLATTLGTISIEALRDHDNMLPWVKSGLEYHKRHGLTSCLLCGNLLTGERIRLVEAAIDDRYDLLVNDIATAEETAQMFSDNLAMLESGLPAKEAIASDQQKSFSDATTALASSIKTARLHIDRVTQLLATKREALNSVVESGDLPELLNSEEWASEHIETTKAINRALDAHNRAHVEFQSSQEAARSKLKRHYLAGGYESYRELESRLKRSQDEYSTLQSQIDGLRAEIRNLKHQMRQHGPAADRVNTMIHKYLGHRELEIATKDEGYEICRNGKVTTSAPSEGEKTAIALSYFLVALEADGRKRQDLIVVMDDPISSLDTRSLNYACSLVKSLGNVAQLIILTHNTHVMNEMKKWLRGRTEKALESKGERKDGATATLLFIDTIQPDGAHSRRSRIVELPKYLREYESEYHYLFHMVLRFLNSEEDRTNYFFVMPNVLRKVLEIFLAFKRPGSSGLSSTIQGLVRDAEALGIDRTRILALERLAHSESHGDNLDALVTASSITIEETQDAAEALLQLVDKMDSEHGRRMRRQCRSAA